MLIKERKIHTNLGDIVIENSLWTCPECLKETNSEEWRWQGFSTNHGYYSKYFCPICNYSQETTK